MRANSGKNSQNQAKAQDQNGLNSENWTNIGKDSSGGCIIISQYRRAVQGQRDYWNSRNVNIFLQGKVQGVTPTYPMLVSTVRFYLRVIVSSHNQFYSCGGLLDIWMNLIIWIFDFDYLNIWFACIYLIFFVTYDIIL